MKKVFIAFDECKHFAMVLQHNFFRWMLKKSERNSQFCQIVLFTDESNFSNTNIQNSRNTRIWAYSNPHTIIFETFYQARFLINVWAGIVGDNIIDSFYLPNSLTGAHYFNFLRSHLICQLRKIIHHRRRQIYHHIAAIRLL